MRQPKKKARKKAKLNPTLMILKEISEERQRQDKKFGEQNWEPGSRVEFKFIADILRAECDRAFKGKYLTWRHILLEEVAEAFSAGTRKEIREELIQVAAVAVNAVESMDRNG